jgi:hypothetical protein
VIFAQLIIYFFVFFLTLYIYKMNLSEQVILLRGMVDTCDKEIKLLERGRKASSARARKSLQNIKATSHSLRKNITTHTKALPVKRRAASALDPASEPEPEPEPVPVPEPETSPAPKKRGRKKKVVV